jgi:hypothetical protein
MPSKAERGREQIAALLADGQWHDAADAYAELAAIGIGEQEARRLRRDLGVQHERRGFPARGLWRLPPAVVTPLPTSEEVRARLGDRIDYASGRHRLAGVLRPVLDAEESGDAEAFEDSLLTAAAELVAWRDRVVAARAHRRRRAA